MAKLSSLMDRLTTTTELFMNEYMTLDFIMTHQYMRYNGAWLTAVIKINACASRKN